MKSKAKDCRNKMKKPFSSDEGVLRYSESEKTAKKEQYILQFSNKE